MGKERCPKPIGSFVRMVRHRVFSESIKVDTHVYRLLL
jgi:hypothetical protein